MGEFTNWLDQIKRYANFKPEELRAAIISILVLAFVISFDKWGPDNKVDLAYGFSNLLLSIIVVSISFFIRIYFQKIMSLLTGHHAEYRLWSFGLLFSLMFAIITYSIFKKSLWFILPGTIVLHVMQGNRIGWPRYGFNYWGLGVISMLGPISSLVLALIFRILFDSTGLVILQYMVFFNLSWAICSILPIPPTDGSRLLFGSRLVYMFTLALIISASVLINSKVKVWIVILGSLLIAVVWWFIYYIVWERFNWKGPF
jgi:hypothetical protein